LRPFVSHGKKAAVLPDTTPLCPLMRLFFSPVFFPFVLHSPFPTISFPIAPRSCKDHRFRAHTFLVKTFPQPLPSTLAALSPSPRALFPLPSERCISGRSDYFCLAGLHFLFRRASPLFPCDLLFFPCPGIPGKAPLSHF